MLLKKTVGQENIELEITDNGVNDEHVNISDIEKEVEISLEKRKQEKIESYRKQMEFSSISLFNEDDDCGEYTYEDEDGQDDDEFDWI